MARRTLRIAMVGCGDISTINVRAIDESRSAEVAYAMDVQEAVARDIGDRCGCPWTTDFQEVLASDGVDAVFICTPHKLHAPLALAAAKAGKHVICEKPIATTVADAKRMVTACRRARVSLSVAYTMRHEAAAVKARALVDAGAIGKVIGVEARGLYRKPDSYWTGGYSGRSKTDWRMSRDMSGGGVLVMNLSHYLDLIYFITGLRAVRVCAEMDTFATRVEVEDYITVNVRYDNGAVGSALAGSCVHGGAYPDESCVRIVGAEGQIVFRNPSRMDVYTVVEASGVRQGHWNRVAPRSPKGGRTDFVERTSQAILAGAAVPLPGEEAIPALEICQGAYRSAATGRAWRAPTGHAGPPRKRRV